MRQTLIGFSISLANSIGGAIEHYTLDELQFAPTDSPLMDHGVIRWLCVLPYLPLKYFMAYSFLAKFIMKAQIYKDEEGD